MIATKDKLFHGRAAINQALKYWDKGIVETKPSVTHYTQIIKERELNYHFNTHFHPYVARLLDRFIQQSIPGLQAADTEYKRNADGTFARFDEAYQDENKRGQFIPVLHQDFFEQTYGPNPGKIKNLVVAPLPVRDLDFTSSGAYSVYNWELFYHVPLMIAMHLGKNGRYAEAQHWFHYIFDPTDNSDGPTPERFWKVKPFHTTDVKLIEEIMINLSTGENPKLRDETINSIMAWKENPFRPHVIARYRQSAYMFKTVFAYIDNLFAWADDDFRKDQPEDVDSALLKYVLIANILGPRPQEVPAKGSIRPQTYKNLKKDLDELGNAMRAMETDVPFNLAPTPGSVNGDEKFQVISSLGNALYFSVPHNEKLLGYWDTVADRLFKIRNSLNLQGIFRQLPLFAPPIDPALLAKAVAAGLDIGAVVAGLNAPMPIVRFQLLLQKAIEICQEVKSLGNNLLSAIEKEDNEALAILRARHEKSILSLTESVKYAQWQEAIKSREGLLVSIENAAQRYIYYEKQLGKKDNEIKLPELSELEKEKLLNLKFLSKEPSVSLRDIEIDIAEDLDDSRGKIVNSFEAEELEKAGLARDIQDVVRFTKLGAQAIRMLPDFGVKFHFWGLGGDMKMGGTTLGEVASYAADVALAIGDRLSFEASTAAKIGSFARREQEWAFQSNTIAGEINQMFKQLRAAQIREAIAEREWKNHQQQIKNAQEIEQFLTNEKTGKKSNQSMYAWMKREVRGLYSQCFQFAYEVAKKAERALQQEIGDPMLSYVQFNYTSGKEGLLAGEKLHMDLKRMEMAYYDLNQREYELTKHISLMQLNPTALLELRIKGRCSIQLPEELFDMDGPGHYFRRIKAMSVSIPCITGPYTSVNCTLTLTKSSIRKKSLLSDGEYITTGDGDDRFDTHFGSMQSIVTSNAQNDSGMFDLNLKDERKLPFEYSGAVSEWQLTLPGREGEVRQFNYETISDVIMHVRYTAREGGELLRKGAMSNLKTKIEESNTAGTSRLFSVRHEFPNDWEKFRTANVPNGQFADLTLNLKEEHYPFWSKGSLNTIQQIVLFAATDETKITVRQKDDQGNNIEDSIETPLGKVRTGKLQQSVLTTPTGQLKLSFDKNKMTDLWIVVKWGG